MAESYILQLMIVENSSIRNIAIIAHVDHGKTTLVDGLFRQSGLAGKGVEGDRVMDSGAIERERGITISAKNCAIRWKGVKINIIDTPGHADFGGEVERGLSMVDGVVLLVDAAEGPLPQTRFVLEKALARNLMPIVVINKIDRSDARPEEVLNEVYDLLLELSPDERMLEVPVFYANGREGRCGRSLDDIRPDLHQLLDEIISYIPAPRYDDQEPFQMLVSDLSYSDFLGRLAIGKVINGSAETNDSLVCVKKDGVEPLRVTRIQAYSGPVFSDVPKAEPGDIIVLAGVNDVSIGDTICTKDEIKALERIEVDEPTVSMLFTKNISPLAGKEGKAVTGAKIWERLQKEALRNVSIRIEKNPDDTFTVKGRGEFQMAIIAEEMRREGFEFCVGRPKVIFHTDEDGNRTEPVEVLLVDCPEESSGTVMEKLGRRKAIMSDITYTSGNRVKIRFEVPARGLIGFRDEFLTDTKGEGILNTIFDGYAPYKGDIQYRKQGSLIAFESGESVTYGLFSAQQRGTLFIGPGEKVYGGMVIGQNGKAEDIELNVCKTKHLTNTRSSSADEALTLTPPKILSLEEALEFIDKDELLEVTPKSLRIRKRILDPKLRKREAMKNS